MNAVTVGIEFRGFRSAWAAGVCVLERPERGVAGTRGLCYQVKPLEVSEKKKTKLMFVLSPCSETSAPLQDDVLSPATPATRPPSN